MISIPDTDPDQSEIADLTSGREISNFRPLEERLASSATAMRALMGNGLTETPGLIRNRNPGPQNRLNLNNPDQALRSMSDRNIAGNRELFGLANRPGYIRQIVDRLFTHIRNPSQRRRIEAIVQRRYRELFDEKRQQLGEAPGLLQDNVIRAEALMDAVAEQVTDADLELVAANVAANMAEDPAYPAAVRDGLRNHYVDANGVLTEVGRDLLNRLRGDDGANASRVLLAFSAALDVEHFDPQAEGLPALPPTASGRPRMNLMSDVLDAPDELMTEDIYQALQRLSSSLQAYESLSDDAVFEDMEPPAAGSPGYGTAYNRYLQHHADYTKSLTKFRSMRRSIMSLEDLLIGIATAPGATINNVPEDLRDYIDDRGPVPVRGVSNRIQEYGTPSRIPDPTEVRNRLTDVGGSISSPAEYQSLIDNIDDNPGLTGADAVDAILGNYIPRVARVGTQTAKMANADLRDRSRAAEQQVRYEREKLSDVPEIPIEEQWDQADTVLEANRDAESWGRKYIGKPVATVVDRIPREINYFVRHELLDMRHPVDIFQANLLQQLGINPGTLNRQGWTQAGRMRMLSDSNDLDELTTRYFTFWHLVNQNDPRVVQNRATTTALSMLREKIIRLQLESITRKLTEKGIDALSEEEVEATGLNSTNFESIDVQALQTRMGAYLDSRVTEPATMAKITPIIDRAQYQIDYRKRRTERHREWRKKYFWSLDNGFANPFMYVNNILYQPAKSLITGKSKHTNIDKVVGVPSRVTQWGVKKLWGGIKSVGNWLNTSS